MMHQVSSTIKYKYKVFVKGDRVVMTHSGGKVTLGEPGDPSGTNSFGETKSDAVAVSVLTSLVLKGTVTLPVDRHRINTDLKWSDWSPRESGVNKGSLNVTAHSRFK